MRAEEVPEVSGAQNERPGHGFGVRAGVDDHPQDLTGFVHHGRAAVGFGQTGGEAELPRIGADPGGPGDPGPQRYLPGTLLGSGGGFQMGAEHPRPGRDVAPVGLEREGIHGTSIPLHLDDGQSEQRFRDGLLGPQAPPDEGDHELGAVIRGLGRAGQDVAGVRDDESSTRGHRIHRCGPRVSLDPGDSGFAKGKVWPEGDPYNRDLYNSCKWGVHHRLVQSRQTGQAFCPDCYKVMY